MVVDAPERVGSAPTGPKFGLVDWVRWIWRQLTAMRTALALLFLGALAAIPGSFVPQRSIRPFAVDQFIADNPQLGAFYDAIGMFSVYTSPWFSAIYLLLLISLVGCIVPRIGTYARALRAEPPRAPRNLNRLPGHLAGTVTDAPQALERAEAYLRKKRFRVLRRGDELSAERGYLREAGNLVFHVALVLILVTVAISVLWGFRGTSATLIGRGFSNNLSFYDDVSAGALFRTDQLPPFTVRVDGFDVRYGLDPATAGRPLSFRADTTVIEGPGEPPRQASIEVNKPLSIDGIDVHLLGYGYAPIVTVTDARGNVGYSGPVIFLPQDGNFTSAGVIKVPDARPQRLAFQGFFLPTATVDEAGPRSVFPDAYSPELFLNAWSGPPVVETGIPENVYQLNPTGLEQFRSADGEPLRLRLKPGEFYDLPNGAGRISFDGWTRWVRLQYSRTPAAVGMLGAIGLAVTGLCVSLFVRPRRIWVRARAGGDGPAEVEVAGLDRVGGRADIDDELAAVRAALQDEGGKEER